MIKELYIINSHASIFSHNQYIVPIYQRGYAWEKEHIEQLIDDIMDVPADGKYYIGTLIVHRRKEGFEVIDGQQRLTTLFLLLQYLKALTGTELSALRFDCRTQSNFTLTHIHEIESDRPQNPIDDNLIQQELLNGYRIIKEKLHDIDTTLLIENLSRTILYRVEVPRHTNLNHYFEIMNTRGEQLEQSDILKARLMAQLQGHRQWQEIFDIIWNACRNMDGYVQMHLPKHIRENLFNAYWDCMPDSKLKIYPKLSVGNKYTEGYSIKEAIKSDFQVSAADSDSGEKQKIRFDSIIDFTYFLLHTLRVYVHWKKITSDVNLLDTMLDDKKLVDAFDHVMRHGMINGRPIRPKRFAKEFIICLLRTRYLFDSFIIKREHTGNMAQDGEWSLKQIHSYGQGGNKKAVYKLSKVTINGGWHNEQLNKEITMLQSAMRVSYTSPKVMHWITELLIWLTDNFDDGFTLNFKEKVENVARKPVVEFLKDEKNFYLGVATPHMVLNYLDYLLWTKNKNENFEFEFRNSVEHWYPRNPSSDDTCERWEDNGAEGVNRFGNLCLIQRNVNSRFSNLPPIGKKDTYPTMIGKGSLKLRKMSDLTTTDNDKWRNESCKQHEQDMIQMLQQACGL